MSNTDEILDSISSQIKTIDLVINNELSDWRLYSELLELIIHFCEILTNLKHYKQSNDILKYSIDKFEKVLFPVFYNGLNELRTLLLFNAINIYKNNNSDKIFKTIVEELKGKKINLSPFPKIDIFEAELLCCKNEWEKAIKLLKKNIKVNSNFIDNIKSGISPLGLKKLI